jgi:hypothetical protein
MGWSGHTWYSYRSRASHEGSQPPTDGKADVNSVIPGGVQLENVMSGDIAMSAVPSKDSQPCTLVEEYYISCILSMFDAALGFDTRTNATGIVKPAMYEV